jgi:hypothetical protein
MLPFLVMLAVLGADGIRRWLRGRVEVLRVVTAVVAAAVFAQGAWFTIDLYTAYPNRDALYFDTGEIAAITTAHHIAAGHAVFLSSLLDQPYIEAFFALLPPPPTANVTDDGPPGLAALGMSVTSSQEAEMAPSPGDILVLSPYDPSPPAGWVEIAAETAPANPLDTHAPQPVLASVWRCNG